MKKIIKYVSIFIIIIFLFYFFFGEMIYKYRLTEKKELTEEQIEKFEQDIKSGKEIDMDEYIIKEKDYTNRLTRLNTGISNMINKSLKKIFRYVLKKINI